MAIEQHMPANRIFGFKIIELREGFAKIHVPFKEDFIGDFIQGVWHGGIIASMADTAAGIAAHKHRFAISGMHFYGSYSTTKIHLIAHVKPRSATVIATIHLSSFATAIHDIGTCCTLIHAVDIRLVVARISRITEHLNWPNQRPIAGTLAALLSLVSSIQAMVLLRSRLHYAAICFHVGHHLSFPSLVILRVIALGKRMTAVIRFEQAIYLPHVWRLAIHGLRPCWQCGNFAFTRTIHTLRPSACGKERKTKNENELFHWRAA